MIAGGKQRMSHDTELRYIGESRDKYVFELVVDHVFQGHCSMRKAHHREFPNVIPDPMIVLSKQSDVEP